MHSGATPLLRGFSRKNIFCPFVETSFSVIVKLQTLRRFVSSFSPQCPQWTLLTQQHTSSETPSIVYTESRGASSTSLSSGESCLVCLLRRMWRYCIPNLKKKPPTAHRLETHLHWVRLFQPGHRCQRDIRVFGVILSLFPRPPRSERI